MEKRNDGMKKKGEITYLDSYVHSQGKPRVPYFWTSNPKKKDNPPCPAESISPTIP